MKVLTSLLVVIFSASGFCLAQAPNSAWVYPSPTGNLLYQLDERGQRIMDFSQCGYRGGTEPLPNVNAVISQSRWVYVSPGTGDDTTLIQTAIDTVEAMTPDANGWRGVVFLNAGEYQLATTITINASGVVLKGAGDGPSTGTRLRATDPRQYTLISVTGSGSRTAVAGTTHHLTQKLVPAGARTFEVDNTAGLAVGQTVIVKRPSTANWIADIDMDQLGPGSNGGEADDVPWAPGSYDLHFDRTITRIDGNWITVDVPLPQTFEQIYGGGQIWRYTWTGRIQQVGIEDIYGFSDYASATDELHAWTFIRITNMQHGWVRNITAQYFGYAAVSIGDGAKWLTVADSQCLDPISVITGGRRYSFNNDGAECSLFVNCYARKGRHDFVFGSTVPGPNAFVHGTADTAYSDTGPHHRWTVGGLFDLITVNGNELNVQNRGNYGTGHGWAGAYMTVWNCKANTFRVRNPPMARNWLVGSVGTISASSAPVGADPAGTYDSSGPSGTGKAVHTRSLYYGQLQQRLKWPDSDFHEVWLGDVDQHASTGGTGEAVDCDAAWLAQVEALGAQPAVAKFDELAGSRHVAFTVDFARTPGEAIVAASLTLSLRAIGNATTDSIRLDSTASPQTFASLGWNPISTTAPTVRTMEVSPALLSDGRLHVALGTNCAVDYAVLHVQVQKLQPSVSTVTLPAVADAYVRGGTNGGTNFGTETSLETKEDSDANFDRETLIRWDLSGITGKIVQAKVRLMPTTTGQPGNENGASLVNDDTWSETAVTFANKPASEKLFAQWLPVANQAVEFSVMPQVKDALLGNSMLSLQIASTDNHGSSGNVSYASRESATAAHRPQLILTIENPPTAVVKASTGSILSADAAWTNGFVPVNPDTATWNSTSLAGTMTFENDLNWAGLIVSNPSGPLTFNSSQFLLLGSAGIDMSASTVNLTLNNPVFLGQNQTWNIATGRNLTVNGPISGSQSLDKSGAGNLVFSGNNTFTGTTAIREGSLQVNAGGTLGANSASLSLGTGSAGVLGTVGNLTLNTSATLGSLTIKSNTATTGQLSIASGSTLTVAGFKSGVIGTDAVRAITNLSTGSAGTGGTLAVNGNFNMSEQYSTTVVNLSGLAEFHVQSPTGSLSLGSNLRSNGTLTLANSTNIINVGTLSLGVTGSNSGGRSTINLGPGTNTIQAPVINIGAGKSAGQILFVGNGGSVVITGAGSSGSSLITIGNSSVGTFTGGDSHLFLAGRSATVSASTVTIGQKSGNGGSTVRAFMTFDTGTFNADTIQMGVAGGTSSGAITSGLTVGGATADSAATGVMNISGNLLLAAATAGTATPTSNLVINGGTVNVNTAASAAHGIYDTSEGAGTSTTSLTLAGGTLNLNGGSIGGTTGTGKKNIGTLEFRSGTLRNVAQINGGAGLTKTSTGTLILDGTNTYTGPTAVSAGKLLINGDQGTASGDVTISANATLGGTGVLGGNTAIAANGKLEFDLSTAAASHDKLELATGKSLTFSGASTLTITGTAGATPGNYTLLTAPGGIIGSAPATLNLPSGWVATVSKVGNDLVLNLTSTGSGPGPVASFAISSIASPQTVGTPITGITLTAKDAANATATGFTGTVTFGGTGGFTGTSANFVSGVLTGVSVTPTVAGSNLTFTVNDGASHSGSVTIATIQTPYAAWATGSVAFDADTNNDGVPNGIAFLLGATDANQPAADKLPIATNNSGNLRLTFRCMKSTKRGGIVLKIQTSNDLGVTDPWITREVIIPDTDSTVNGVVFDTTGDGDYVNVIADIPISGSRTFARLYASPTP